MCYEPMDEKTQILLHSMATRRHMGALGRRIKQRQAELAAQAAQRRESRITRVKLALGRFASYLLAVL